jgi:glycosidase
MKLAALVQFTFIGTPCLYYGDEIGLTGGHDPGCRKCMEWDPARQDRDLLAFYRWLIALRRSAEALRTGDFRVLRAEAGERVFAYMRSAGQERYAIVVNNQDQPASVRIPLGDGTWTDVRTREAMDTSNGAAEAVLEPFGFRIWHASAR